MELPHGQVRFQFLVVFIYSLNMASLSHVKGVITHFRNTLEDKMKQGNDKIISDIDYCDIYQFKKDRLFYIGIGLL
jgi:hypothetical protein